MPIALIFGNESKGISPDLIELSDVSIKIPLLGNIESLNVSVAAGIIIYEAVRNKI
jgi:23S rRNA (guanosine2251-2'-O)-methyltransferase